MRAHARRPLRDFLVRGGQRTGEVNLELRPERRVRGAHALDRVEQEHVRTREEVDSGRGSPEQPAREAAPPQPAAEVGVQRAGVHDPERAVRARRRLAVEVRAVEAVRDRRDERVPELREPAHPRRGLARVHDDGVGGGERPAHPAELQTAVEAARVDAHLVERPRILEVDEQRLADRARDGDRRLGGLVRSQRGVDEVDVTAGLARDRQDLREPPALPLRAEPQPALGALPPAAAARRLGRGHPVHGDRARDPRGHRVVHGRPVVVGRAGPGDDDRVVAELRQVARELGAPLRARAADRREEVRQEEDAPARRGHVDGASNHPKRAFSGRRPGSRSSSRFTASFRAWTCWTRSQ